MGAEYKGCDLDGLACRALARGEPTLDRNRSTVQEGPDIMMYFPSRPLSLSLTPWNHLDRETNHPPLSQPRPSPGFQLEVATQTPSESGEL
jgi:hypothetical protein